MTYINSFINKAIINNKSDYNDYFYALVVISVIIRMQFWAGSAPHAPK